MTAPLLQPYALLLSGVAAIALLTTGFLVGTSQTVGRNILKPRHFRCEQLPDGQNGKLFWTVLYQPSTAAIAQPWLRIVKGIEGDASLEARCEQAAQKLDVLYPQGLQTLRYQPNPATPGRAAICVETARSRDTTCHTLLILQPDTPPDLFFAQLTQPLQPAPTSRIIAVDLTFALPDER